MPLLEKIIMLFFFLSISAKTGGGPNLWAPHRLVKLMDVKVRTVASACTACHSAVITTDGKVLTWGKSLRGNHTVCMP
jgi:hypothetical protein